MGLVSGLGPDKALFRVICDPMDITQTQCACMWDKFGAYFLFCSMLTLMR